MDPRAALVSGVRGSSVGGGVLAHLLPQLCRLTGAPRGLALTLAVSTDGFAAGRLHAVRLEPAVSRAAIQAALAANPRGVSPLMPLCTAGRDRNRPVALRLTSLPPGAASLACALGVAGEHALRLVAWDGDVPLAWLAMFRDRPFAAEEQELLAWVAPPLRARLQLETDVSDAPVAAAALQPALEAIAAPAFVLDGAGRVERVNGPGRALLARDPAAREELCACARGAPCGRFTVKRLAAPGIGEHVLAIAPAPDAGLAARLVRARDRWRLTPRQAEVLARIARGCSNKTIASDLACAESTVEVHVSALLAKSACESRAEAVAQLWSDGAEAAPPLTVSSTVGQLDLFRETRPHVSSTLGRVVHPP